MDTLRADLTYALRATRGRPGTAPLCVLTLSLGVGASTAMFMREMIGREVELRTPSYFCPFPMRGDPLCR